jgi:hypothetical protein
MKTASKNMTWKVAAMVVALSLLSAPVFALDLSSMKLQTTVKLVRPGYLVLYNDSGQDVYDVQVFKLMYMDVNGFYHWEKIKDVAYIALHTQAVVTVPSDVGLSVLYCRGVDGCRMDVYDPNAGRTGDFGPIGSAYFTVTLH